MTKRRSRGDGGLHWDENRQRWIASVTVGYTPAGKRIVRKASGKTKTEARTKLREKIRDHEMLCRRSSVTVLHQDIGDSSSGLGGDTSPGEHESVARVATTEGGAMSAQQPWHLLHGYLAWTRSHVLSAVADLDDGELRAPRVPSGWSMAELVHHLAVDVERFWFLAVMAADPEAVGYFEEATASGWTIPAHLAPSGVLDLYRDECAKTDAYLANAAADSAPRWWPTGSDDELPADLAAVFVHALVDTATHAGHLDIVRELVDGKQFLVLDR